MTNRSTGGGRPHKRSDGRWQAIVEVGIKPDGSRDRRYVYARTAKAADEKATALKAQLLRGGPPTGGRTSLRDFAVEYLAIKRTEVKATTYQRYEQLLRLHVIPHMGQRRLEGVTARDLRSLYATLGERLAPQSVGHVHRLLHNVFEEAIRLDMVHRNPTKQVNKPRVPRHQMKVLTVEETGRLLEVARTHRLGALVTTAVGTGARQGELLALRWEDVDLDSTHPSLRITRTLTRVAGGGFDFTEPKTAHSRRRVDLAKSVVAALRRHRTTQHRERLRAGREWHDLDLLFCRPDGRPLDATHVTKQVHYPLLERAGLPRVRFHDLRHTAATLLLGQRVHPKIVSEMLGHGSIAITLDTYSHALPTMQRQAAEVMDTILGGASER